MLTSVMHVDTHILSLIRKYVGKSKFLDKLASWCAEYSGYLILLLVGFQALYAWHWQLFFVPVLAGLVTRFGINETIYAFYQRKRPSEILEFNPLIKKPRHPAFPSGHAAFFFGFVFAVFAYSVPLAAVCLVLAVLMGLARVFCSVHWPSDILAGGAAAGLVSMIFWYLLL